MISLKEKSTYLHRPVDKQQINLNITKCLYKSL